MTKIGSFLLLAAASTAATSSAANYRNGGAASAEAAAEAAAEAIARVLSVGASRDEKLIFPTNGHLHDDATVLRDKRRAPTTGTATTTTTTTTTSSKTRNNEFTAGGRIRGVARGDEEDGVLLLNHPHHRALTSPAGRKAKEGGKQGKGGCKKKKPASPQTNVVKLNTKEEICGKEFSEAKKYIITSDVICDGNGIAISGDASLDCEGHTVSQNESTTTANIGMVALGAAGKSVLVQNCNVEGFGLANFLVTVEAGGGRAVLANSSSKRTAGIGLFVSEGGEANILEFTATESGAYGIAFSDQFTGSANLQNPKVDGSIRDGVVIGGSCTVNIQNPEISGSGTLENGFGDGIWIRGAANVGIFNPNIYGNARFGIYNTGGESILVNGGIIEDNFAGIYNRPTGAGSVNVVGVTIRDNVVTGFVEAGVNVASEVSIVASTITNNGRDGVGLLNAAATVSIQCSSIDSNEIDGVAVSRVAKLSIQDSSITSSGNINFLIRDSAVNGVVILSNSQFCDSDGPDGIDIQDNRADGNKLKDLNLAKSTCDLTDGLGGRECGITCDQACTSGVPDFCEAFSAAQCYN